MKEYLKTEIKDNYAIIEFFHPSHNSLHTDLLLNLKLSIEKLEDNAKVKCILLKSGGNRTFCAGANFDEMKSIDNLDNGKKFFSGFGNLIQAIKNSSKLIIGRVQGKTVGGGVGVISACDIAFGTMYSSIRLSELSIGIGPYVIAPAVIRKIGFSAFSDLSLNPKSWKDASWCKEKGLFSEVFADMELLDSHVDEYISELCSYNLNSLSEMKKMLWYGTDHWKELMEERADTSGKLVLKLDLT